MCVAMANLELGDRSRHGLIMIVCSSTSRVIVWLFLLASGNARNSLQVSRVIGDVISGLCRQTRLEE